MSSYYHRFGLLVLADCLLQAGVKVAINAADLAVKGLPPLAVFADPAACTPCLSTPCSRHALCSRALCKCLGNSCHITMSDVIMLASHVALPYTHGRRGVSQCLQRDGCTVST